jgi:hypothetical protein
LPAALRTQVLNALAADMKRYQRSAADYEGLGRSERKMATSLATVIILAKKKGKKVRAK